jgi:hypothetical protein
MLCRAAQLARMHAPLRTLARPNVARGGMLALILCGTLCSAGVVRCMPTNTSSNDYEPVLISKKGRHGTHDTRNRTPREAWELKFRCPCGENVRKTAFVHKDETDNKAARNRVIDAVDKDHGHCLSNEVIVEEAEEPSAATPPRPRARPRHAAEYPTPGKDNFPPPAVAEAEPVTQFVVPEEMTDDMVEEDLGFTTLKLRSRNQLFPPGSMQQSPLRDRSVEALRLRDTRRSIGCVSVRNPSPSPRLLFCFVGQS